MGTFRKIRRELFLIQKRKGFITLDEIMETTNFSRSRAFNYIYHLKHNGRIEEIKKGESYVFILNTSLYKTLEEQEEVLING